MEIMILKNYSMIIVFRKKLLKSECYLFTDIKEIKTQDNNIDDYLMKFSFLKKKIRKI